MASGDGPSQLSCADYHVAWICPVADVELLPARLMLDEELPIPQYHTHYDENTYICGTISGHTVVIATCPQGETGNVNAGRLTGSMFRTFPNIRMAVLVGIGGGIPSLTASKSSYNDIHLGDVVVGWPGDGRPACVYHNRGRSKVGGEFEMVGTMQNPDWRLTSALSILTSDYKLRRTKFHNHLARLQDFDEFAHPGLEHDRLFKAANHHIGSYESDCTACDPEELVQRLPRTEDDKDKFIFHQGRIATGNEVVQDGELRDRIGARCGGALCVEMEAAGVDVNRRCLVIRGISDYADSHKNDLWRSHAAGNAAAFTRELLCRVQPSALREMQGTAEAAPWLVPSASSHITVPPAKRRKTDQSGCLENDVAPQQRTTPASSSHIKHVLQAPPQLSTQQEACLKSLSFPEQEHRYDDIHVARNTCEWLLQDAEYRAWIDKSHGLFWIKGNPGAGKSVLMKHAVKSMREHNPNYLVIPFFFHGQGVDLQKTPLGLFRALLNFLLEHFPEYLMQLTVKFEEREKRYGSYTADRWKWTENELQEILFSVLTKGVQHRPVVIFVDALDECGEGPAKRLLAYFEDIMKEAGRETGLVKVCVSSRHYPILSLATVPAVLVEERNDADIRWYTQEQLRGIQPKLKRTQIEEEILSKAKGGFQWVFLVTQTIVGRNLAGIRAEELLEELTSCPQTLGELYAAILTGVPEAEWRRMMKIFQWVLFAKRPLSAQELRDALAIDREICCTYSDLRAQEGWSDSMDDFERYVKYISRGLIYFQSREIWEQYIQGGEDSDREAQLIHQSVADYLSETFVNGISHDGDFFRSQAAAGHFQISRSCLKYLTLKEILEESQSSRGDLSSRFPLAPYAVRFLVQHIQFVEQEGIIQSDLLSALQWTPKSDIMQKLANVWRTLDPDSTHIPLGWPFVEATAIHVLAALGTRSAVDVLLETSDVEVDDRDSNGNTPLMLAIREGHEDLALMLLDWSLDQHKEDNAQIGRRRKSVRCSASRLVDVNAKNKDEDTVLDIALDQKAENVILRLIEAGATLKYMGRETALVSHAISNRNMDLLSVAIERQLNLDGAIFFALKDCSSQPDRILEDIISKLLKAGATTARSSEFERNSWPEDADGDEDEERHDNNALLIASRRGLVDMVNLLLSHGSSAYSRNEVGECPLLVATESCHGEVVQSLLRSAPSTVELEDYEGHTALSIAVNVNYTYITKLLLEEGSFSDSSQVFKDVLFNAARYGDDDITEVLLHKDVNPDYLYGDGRTPLSYAAEMGHDVIVKLLLDTGKINIDSKDKKRRTPLSYAAEMGHEAVVKVLLDTGKIEADSKDKDGRTPLLWAAFKGCKAVAKLLLETCTIDPNSKDNDGRTPLSRAASTGHEAVVKLLLDTGTINADSKDNDGRTPLLWAASNGHEAVVKLLLDTGTINADSKDNNGRTPLLWAVYNSHAAIVKLLLNTGKIDADSKDNYGWSPLLWATFNGHKVVVKLLLDGGEVDVNAEDREGSTPLLWAVQHGHEEIVRLLLATNTVNMYIEDRNGFTPLSWATKFKQEAMVKLLQAYRPKPTT